MTSAETGSRMSRACAVKDVPSDGSIITRTLNGKSVAISRNSPDDQRIVAFEARCPHMKAPLRFGRVVQGEVICPWHFFRFSTKTGAPMACGESLMKLKIYPADIRDGDVYVRVTD